MRECGAELQHLLDTIDTVQDRLVAAVVHLNDTYLIEERKEARLPGFPRVSVLPAAKAWRLPAVGRDFSFVDGVHF
jgi:hypothetical protein